MIFPRFHQWDAVLRLEAAARAEGAGQNVPGAALGRVGQVEHDRLARAPAVDPARRGDKKVFDKVVVITDRLVLDRQLQDTIYQFEHAHGVVEQIDEIVPAARRRLAGEQARIIITTLQKFPFVLDKVESLPGRRYAVIVDEAHSSQTGEAAKELQPASSAPGQRQGGRRR